MRHAAPRRGAYWHGHPNKACVVSMRRGAYYGMITLFAFLRWLGGVFEAGRGAELTTKDSPSAAPAKTKKP